MQTSNIPPHITDGTFSNRSHQTQTVETIDRSGITLKESRLGMVARPEVLAAVRAGDQITIEYLGPRPGIGSVIMGVAFEGRWLYETSDEQHEEFQAEIARRSKVADEKFIEENKGKWAEIHVGLPAWLQPHAKSVLDKCGETMDYGYSLMALALAAMYAEQGDEILDKNQFTVEDVQKVSDFAREHGTTGNQHGMGLALAKAHLRGEV